MPSDQELGSLIIALQADIKNLKVGLQEGNTQLNKFSQDVTAQNKRMADMTRQSMSQIKSYIIGAFSIAAITKFTNDSIAEYKRQIDAETLLTAALGKRSKVLLEQADALQKVTTFGDEQIIEAQSMVANLVKEEAVIQRLTPLVLDFATAKRIDAKTAGELIAKTYASGTNALSRYGIKVEGAAGSTERLTMLTEALEKAFHGQAEALAATPVGQLEVMKNRISEIKEGMGKDLLPTQLAWNTALEQSVKLLSSALKVWGELWALAGARAGGMSSEMAPHFVKLQEIIAEGDVEKLKIAITNLEMLERFHKKIVADLEARGAATKKVAEAERELLAVQLMLYQAKSAASSQTPTGGPTVPTGSTTKTPEELTKAYSASLEQALATTKWVLSEIDAAYKSASITASEYFDARTREIDAAYAKEKSLLQSIAANATDDEAKTKAKTALIELETKHTEDLTKIVQERAAVEEKIEKDKNDAIVKSREARIEIESALEEQRIAGIVDQNARELAELNLKHKAEIQAFREKGATEAQIDQLNKDQELERARVQSKKELEIKEKQATEEAKLQSQVTDFISSTLGKTAQTFKKTYDLIYETTGKKSKEMFLLWKALAIAQATVDTATGAVSAYKAMAGIPYVGPELGAVAAGVVIAFGAVEIAAIAATEMKEGGLLKGKRHSAGGIPVEAEGGEFFEPVDAVQHYGAAGLQFLEAFRRRALPRDTFAQFAGMGLSPRGSGSFAAEGGVVSGGSSPASSTIVNFIDPALFDRYLASVDGQKAVVNVMRANRYELQRLAR